MHPLLTRFSGSSLRLLLSVIYLLLTLFLVGCSSLDISSSMHTNTPTTSTTGNTTPTTADQTATASATSTPTAAPTQGGTPQTGTAASAPVPFKVTGVAFGAWPGDHQGVCRTNTYYTASVLIYAPAHTTGGTVTYTWLRSDTSTISPSSVTFAAGTTSRMVTSIWSMNIPLVPESLQPLLISLTGVPGMAYIRPSFLVNPLMAPSIADPTPMHQTLIDLADEDRIEHSPIHLIVTATDVETGQLTRFENHIPNEPFTFEMVAASGSIAPVFPMTSVTEQITGKEGRYWDGGFVASLPLSPVINFLGRCEGGDPDVERVAIAIEVNPRRSRLPRNMLEIVNRFSQLITASKLKLDQKMFDKMDSHIELFQLLDQHLTDEDRKKILRDPKLSKTYEDLKSHRKIYCIVIEMTRPESLTGPSNFSKSAIEDRIECGYEDTYQKLVDEGIITDVREYAIPASA